MWSCPGNMPKYYPGNIPKYYGTKYHYKTYTKYDNVLYDLDYHVALYSYLLIYSTRVSGTIYF